MKNTIKKEKYYQFQYDEIMETEYKKLLEINFLFFFRYKITPAKRDTENGVVEFDPFKDRDNANATT